MHRCVNSMARNRQPIIYGICARNAYSLPCRNIQLERGGIAIIAYHYRRDVRFKPVRKRVMIRSWRRVASRESRSCKAACTRVATVSCVSRTPYAYCRAILFFSQDTLLFYFRSRRFAGATPTTAIAAGIPSVHGPHDTPFLLAADYSSKPS